MNTERERERLMERSIVTKSLETHTHTHINERLSHMSVCSCLYVKTKRDTQGREEPGNEQRAPQEGRERERERERAG